MKDYELLYIIPSRFTEQEIAGVQVRVSGLIEKAGAKVTREEVLGKIKLAYSVKRDSHGTYVLVYFDTDPASVKELDRSLKLEESILRHTLLCKPTGADKRKFTLAAYVPPQTDGIPPSRRPGETASSAPTPRTPAAAPARRPAAAPVAPVVATVTTPAQSSMTMEELDKKLDEILQENDLSETA